jgi:preprotein translocase subunit SecE
MNIIKAKSQNEASKKDIFLWILTFVLLGAGLGLDYYYKDVVWSLRVTGWIVLACILAFIIFQTNSGKVFWGFAKESRAEMRKIVWPVRQDTVRTTIILACLVLLAALITWGADSILLWAIGWLTGQRG